MKKVLGIHAQIARVMPPLGHGIIETEPPPRHRRRLVTELCTTLPFLVDEAGGGVDTSLQAIAGGAMDVVDRNIGRAGRLATVRL